MTGVLGTFLFYNPHVGCSCYSTLLQVKDAHYACVPKIAC